MGYRDYTPRKHSICANEEVREPVALPNCSLTRFLGSLRDAVLQQTPYLTSDCPKSHLCFQQVNHLFYQFEYPLSWEDTALETDSL